MRERTVNVNGDELWVAEQGKGKPLVLCTGRLGFCDYLEPIAEILDDLVLVYRLTLEGVDDLLCRHRMTFGQCS